MDTLLIIHNSGKTKEVSLDLGAIVIGPQMDADVQLDLSTNISFLRKKDSLIAEADKKNKSFQGNWGKELKRESILLGDEYTFVYLPNTKVDREGIKDWDASAFPKNYRKNAYPTELLDFLLSIITSDQGAILYFKDKKLKSLASRKIYLREQSELFLQRILEDNDESAVINMNYNTHTLLFDAGLTPLDFCIIQYSLSENEKIVLYLPRTTSMKDIPEGMMSTILCLCAGNIANHLLYKKQRELEEQVENIDRNFFWGNSPKMKSLKSYVEKLSKTNLSILINGETGTGKEMLVNYLKNESDTHNIISVNCAAIPKDLAESVLFGHKKGAFTGAHQDQIGKIEEANGGILFLDEIGELELDVQAKLLRTIQEGIVSPVGGKDKKVNFWLISATHKDLEEMIESGEFREDLFFRINEASIKMPALRERSEDIPALATYFLNDVINLNRLDRKVFDNTTLDYLKESPWKGNIRELKSFIRKIALLSDNEIISLYEIEALGLLSKKKGNSKSYPDDLQEAKKQFIESHIDKILQQCGGNKTQAAKVLGITTRNLYRLIPEKSDINDMRQ